jgi:hypothetical protein
MKGFKDSGVGLTDSGRAARRRELDYRLQEMANAVSDLRTANNRLEEHLGSFSVGAETTQAVATTEGKVSIRKNGRDVTVFTAQKGLSVAESLHEAKMAARRAFERLANRELTKRRTLAECKQTIAFDGATLRTASNGQLEIVGPQLELVDQ